MSLLSPVVIKIGGKFFDEMRIDETSVEGFFNQIEQLVEQKRNVILVHGGGTQVTSLIQKIGGKTQKIDGLRVTPDEHIDLVAGVLAGQLNKRLVAKLYSRGITAAGISLADGNMAKCTQVSKALGWVGEPSEGDATLLDALLEKHIIPIVATIGCDADGNLYNVNADHAAMHIAKLLDAELMLLSDVAGVLDADKSLIDVLRAEEIKTLIDALVITDGMLVKVNAAKAVADQLQQTVTIASWTDSSGGTRILPNTAESA
ncbi:MAG: acetylglutamate kinase [Pseudomonadota bacterium]